MAKYGKTIINEGGNQASYGRPCLEVTCSFGKVVAYNLNMDGFSEIAIDLLRDDGKVLQLAVVGVDELGNDNIGDPNYQQMHVYCYDGQTGEVANTQYVTVNEDSAWED